MESIKLRIDKFDNELLFERIYTQSEDEIIGVRITTFIAILASMLTVISLALTIGENIKNNIFVCLIISAFILLIVLLSYYHRYGLKRHQKIKFLRLLLNAMNDTLNNDIFFRAEKRKIREEWNALMVKMSDLDE